ncbi:hydroxyacylglutathione hydrolase, mitochondrial isoform X2 [Cephus cinctus]|uniref:hydroxyacylglutathione hydrolase n=1 Tax=Cephus cinctus TaxID=211228 RepID=A0AAJ7FLK8_CEPCN|nr:hydroxyacylglutathione hydrolase, mitochondrial isoform X2 [Cephus cinctus]XP_024942089.1 hydroxyacylglutathione hydrolase, mitochondrial isoform X2 [Cephus cinctus]
MFNSLFRACPTWLESQVTAAYFKAKSFSTNGFRGTHSICSTVQQSDMKVQILPALQDNYMYLIIDEESREAAIVDPVDPNTVASAVEKNNVNLTKVLTTHHHWDHAGGNENLCKKFNNLQVYGGDDRIGALNCKVKQGDTIKIGNLEVTCLQTPCHTSGHICYYITNGSETPAVFTGDTLFAAGCGRFFEGTAEQMYKALIEILGKLPDETNVYCGHEYTENNLKFAVYVEPENQDILKKIEWSREKREKQEPTVPSTIDAIKTMEALRKEKDSFKC